MERQNTKAVLSEQVMAELGIVKQDGRAAKSGQMTGAQYVILGRISGFENNVETKQSGGGMRFMGFGGSKTVAESKAYVSLDLRIVDTTTGEVVGFKTVEGRATNTAKVKGSGGSLAPLAGLVGGLTGASGAGAYGLAAAGTLSFNESSSETKKLRERRPFVLHSLRHRIMCRAFWCDKISVWMTTPGVMRVGARTPWMCWRWIDVAMG